MLQVKRHKVSCIMFIVYKNRKKTIIDADKYRDTTMHFLVWISFYACTNICMVAQIFEFEFECSQIYLYGLYLYGRTSVSWKSMPSSSFCQLVDQISLDNHGDLLISFLKFDKF